jgi:hypothetical protein
MIEGLISRDFLRGTARSDKLAAVTVVMVLR